MKVQTSEQGPRHPPTLRDDANLQPVNTLGAGQRFLLVHVWPGSGGL